jgi:DNA-binding IclR family transcriptional regulator
MSNAIKRAVKILDILSEEGPLNFTQIMQEMNLSKSSTHDLLKTMEEEGLVWKDHYERRYFLGNQLVKFGNKVQLNSTLIKLAKRPMQELREAVDETVFLAVLESDKQVIIDSVESNQSLRTSVALGTKDYLHYTSLGKAMMAFMQEERVNEIIKGDKLKRKTENTITDQEDFKKELRKIRQQGYAVDNMEHSKWVRCVGAPILNHAGEVLGAISVSGPPSRLQIEDIPVTGKLVTEKAMEISMQLGYRPELISRNKPN